MRQFEPRLPSLREILQHQVTFERPDETPHDLADLMLGASHTSSAMENQAFRRNVMTRRLSLLGGSIVETSVQCSLVPANLWLMAGAPLFAGSGVEFSGRVCPAGHALDAATFKQVILAAGKYTCSKRTIWKPEMEALASPRQGSSAVAALA